MTNPLTSLLIPRFCLLLLLICCTSGLRAQLSTSQIDQLVEQAMKKFNVVGASVGIVKDGKIIHTKGYGFLSSKSKVKVNEHTQFAIASNSKAFTTAALALLVEDGKISWTDKVKTHIPEFKMYNEYVTENFNIQDLLTHRSGLGLGAGDLMFFPDGSDFTVKDVLSVFQHFSPQSAFRTKFDYDNLLYTVAGELIARVSSSSWEEFVEKRIIHPLNMDRSYTSLKGIKDKSNLANPHNTASGTTQEFSNFVKTMNGAAGGIFSNADDLCNWMLVHLNKGKYGAKLDKKLFSEENQREMWKIHTSLNASRNPRYNAHFSGYGLGWFLTDIKGNMSVSHTGGLPGMLSKTILIPDLKLGVVVLTNTEPGGGELFSAVTQTIVDSYLGLDDYNWTDHYAKLAQESKGEADSVSGKVWETVRTANQKAFNPQDYTGVYEDKWFGKVEVFMKNEQLWIRSYRSPKLNGAMQYYKANAFAVKWAYQDMNADALAIFSLDEEGKAQRIQMKGISPDIDFSFDFQDLDLRRVKSTR